MKTQNVGMSVLAALALGALGCARSAPTPAAGEEAVAAERVRSPGKTGAPVRVESQWEGRLEPGAPVSLRVTVTPEKPCEQLSTELRGVEGVQVSGEPVREHGACVPGQPVVHEVQARLESASAGLVSVTVGLRREGRTQGMARAILLEPEGVSAATAAVPDGRPLRLWRGEEEVPLLLLDHPSR